MNGSRDDTRSVAEALENARELLLKHPAAAAQQARNVISVEPGIGEAYIILACALRALNDHSAAQAMEEQGLLIARNDPVIQKATDQISAGKLREADLLLNLYLADTPNDPVAVYLRSTIQNQLGDTEGARSLLSRVRSLAPNFAEAREALEAMGTRVELSRDGSDEWFTTRFTDPPGSRER